MKKKVAIIHKEIVILEIKQQSQISKQTGTQGNPTASGVYYFGKQNTKNEIGKQTKQQNK